MNRCCQSLVVFSSTIIRSKSKEKGKRRGCGKYLKKKQHKEFTITYCRRCVLMIGNRISGDMYNELFRESNQHKNAIKNCPIALQTFSFLSLSLFVSFISFFIKARILLQFLSQVFSILYMFSLFPFFLINALITSTSTKIS